MRIEVKILTNFFKIAAGILLFGLLTAASAKASTWQHTTASLLSHQKDTNKSKENILTRIISINIHDVPLKEGLKAVADKGDFKLVYSSKFVSRDKKVSLSGKYLTVKKALGSLLSNTGLGIETTNRNQIIIVHLQSVETKQQPAQTGTITGTVTDAKTGQSMVGVSVYLKGTTTGNQTTKNGHYKITGVKPGNYTLIAQFIGYKKAKKEVTIKANETLTVNFVLSVKVGKLNDFVVTGYRKIKKRKLTSAVAQVKMANLPMQSYSTIGQMLQGQIPGVSIVKNSGQVGAVPRIRVRGTATLTGSAQPLWVIDGVIQQNPVPLSPAEINSPNVVNRIGNAISSLNPGDIKSITILKDASATAMYGTKAANGVIVITTKDGKSGPPQVNYTGTVGLKMRPRYSQFNMMNSKQRIEVAQYYFNANQQYYNADANIHSPGLAGFYARYKNRELATWQDFQNAVRHAQTLNTDWFDILFRNSLSVTNNINISGGNDNSTYFVSFSALNQKGSNIKTNNKRYTGLINYNTNLSDNFRVQLKLSGYLRNRNSFPRSQPISASNFEHPTPTPFHYALNTSRTFPVYKNGEYYSYRPHRNFYLFNILNEYRNSNEDTRVNGFSSLVRLTYDVTNKLTMSGLFSYSNDNTFINDYYKANTNYVAGIRRSNFGAPTPILSVLPRGGIVFKHKTLHQFLDSRARLEYRPIDTKNNQVQLLAGIEYRKNKYRGDQLKGWGYLHDRGLIISTSENIGQYLSGSPYLIINHTTEKNASYYGIATYTYKNKYTVNLNARFDGSNLFGSNPKYRWKPTYSISGRWNITNESFMKPVGFINLLALKASYGIQGSTNEQSTPQLVATFMQQGYWTELNQLAILQPANPDLRWEKTYSTNLGLTFKMFNYRVQGAVNFYNRLSKGLIIDTRISTVNGFSFLPINFADVTNKGAEFGITTTNIRQKHISWNTTFNFSYNRNRVHKVNLDPNVAAMLSNNPNKPSAAIVGHPISSLYSVNFGYIDNNGVAHFIKANGDTTAATTGLNFSVYDLEYSGPIIPPYSGGINNSLKYDNFEFSFLFTYSFGNKLRKKAILSDRMYAPDQNMSKELLKAWGFNGNTDTNVPNLLNVIGIHTYKDYWNTSDIRVMDGGYLRLSNVRLRYNLPTTLSRQLGITQAYIQVVGNNLLLFDADGLHGLDPETIMYGNSLPNLRSFAFTLHIAF